MKKLIIKLFLALTICLFFLQFVDKFFLNEDRFNEAYSEFKDKDYQLSILFIGSSKSYGAYNPSIFNKFIDGESYNLGSSSQLLETTKFLLKENLKKNKALITVVDFSRGLVDFPSSKDTIAFEKSKFFQHLAIDPHNVSLNKIQTTYKLFNSSELINSLSPTIRNHVNWNKIFLNQKNKTSFIYRENDIKFYNNGYTGSNSSLNKEDQIIAKILNKHYSEALKDSKVNSIISKRVIELIKEIAEISKKNNSKIIFVTSPSIIDYENSLNYYENFELIMDSLNIDYLNLNKKMKQMNLNSEHFIDLRHLNYKGSKMVSEFLSNYLIDNYNLKRNTVNIPDCKSITCNLYNNLSGCKPLLEDKFVFEKDLLVNKISYFNEVKDQYVFIFEVPNQINDDILKDLNGYIRYYNGEVNDTNKKVESFSIKVLNIDNKKYFFTRMIIPNPNISKFDIFFMKKGTSNVSKFYTKKDFKLAINKNK